MLIDPRPLSVKTKTHEVQRNQLPLSININ